MSWPGQEEAYWDMQGIEQAIHESTTTAEKLRIPPNPTSQRKGR